jgi:ubiquinone/menaquinone biosynthesis C-methylase UbiE
VRWPWKSKPQLTADLRRRIRKSFNDAAVDEEHFPSEIDPRIYHVRALLDYFGDLAGRRLLDAGCGKGRFARIFQQQHPTATICGMDIAEAMLRSVPVEIAPCAGSLVELPFRSAVFDGVYAVESLEHAVEIEQAVSELCRVLKPGGRLAIIDKNVGHWGRLDTPDWEKWFRPRELEKLLSRHCREVSSRFISYWEDVEPDGLFVAWFAVK